LASRKSLHVALVGMGFGGSFAGIYLKHPAIRALTIVDTDEKALIATGDLFQIPRRTTRLDDVIQSSDIDAVHLVTPIPLHAEQTVRVLESGKHCACTVPAATSIADLKRIVAAQRKSGKCYMMMETSVYTRYFLYAKTLQAEGGCGNIQMLRGAHYQDMENWPPYWMGLPPMWYATHAISPLLAIAGTRAERVHCFGSGVMRDELKSQYNNPFPAETAIYRLDGHPAAMEVTRTLFHTVRQYTEGFCIYGEKKTLEWMMEPEEPLLQTIGDLVPGRRGTGNTMERVTPPDRPDLLPESIQRFTVGGTFDDTNPQLAFKTGGGHHGSHPHLVHEFVSSIVENRKPAIDAVTAADWTAAGICAHESALNEGKEVLIPDFRP